MNRGFFGREYRLSILGRISNLERCERGMESFRYVWVMVCYFCGKNLMFVVKELLKIKIGKWVEFNCE